ncbi:alpha-glucosidase [Luteibacter aegosomaticola]|uniref:alpha-glucosidase n=1 Tax=Luteibacter aegosomaticola TaxID=2911538 RepID=UPI001FF7C50B|nr:alpha-glucosidase [Luteibacter aegosomaticola]UPG90725.1 alpha-glucosidase [Luteibacter aegosomaticola]
MRHAARRLAAATFLTLAPALGLTAEASSISPWWKHAVVLEVYPRSYADSNGDGVGDLNGITSHLDDVVSLGADTIWITPMYPSPQVDFGYDIADYQAVDPQYGSLADFDRMVAEAKKRHVHVVLDMVMNHTSDKNPWFVDSARSRTSAHADWYVWNDGVDVNAPGVTAFQKRYVHDGKVPPNNWQSMFGGTAWEWAPSRKQFYYHRFYPQQPDLNWRNPAVEKAMFGAIRFWLDRGVDGFRLDAISTLFEDTKLRNDPERGGTNPHGDPNLHYAYSDKLPEVHDVMRRLRKLVDAYPGDRVLIGETYEPTTEALVPWYGGKAQDELQLPMDMLPGFGWGTKFDAAWFRKHLEDAQVQLEGGTPLMAFDNHDNERSIDRYGDGKHDIDRAKVLAALLFMNRGVAMTYYGAPLGMTTSVPARKEDVRDPVGIANWPNDKGRDGERTPMQWTAGPQAGFSTNPATWLPVATNYSTVNVASELKDPQSLLQWYRTLIALRQDNPAIRDGRMVFVDRTNPDVLAWVREGEVPVLVAMNFSDKPRVLKTGLEAKTIHTLAASTPALSGAASLDGTTLPPFSAWVVSFTR